MIGKEILGYRVDEKIGSGGFGTVYKVSKTNAAGTYVRALKHITLPTKKQYASVLNSMGGDYAKADDYFAGVLKDIVSEIKILSTLSESGIRNIVRYYENDIIETQSPKSYDIYILMEFLTPFPDYFESRSFTVGDVIHLGKDILSAMVSFHAQNVIHRDIKDDNIFVSSDGEYKLGDFGVSKTLKDKSRAESVKGTPNFIAPEVYLGKEKYDHTVDVYSLGIVLYKLLNKSRNPFLPAFPAPYSTNDEDAAFEARMRGEIPTLPTDAQNGLGEAIVKAILPRAQRYDSAQEFLDALQNAERALSTEELAKAVNIVIPTPENQTREVTRILPQNNKMNETVGSEEGLRRNVTIEEKKDNDLFTTMGAPIGAPSTLQPPTPGYQQPAPGYQQPAPGYQQPAPGYQPPAPGNQPPTPGGYQPYNPPVHSEPVQVPAVTKKDFKWLAYLMPIILVATYITLYVFVFPRLFLDKAFGAIDLLFTNPGEILEALKNPDTWLNSIYVIIGVKILGWLLIGGFIASLFFFGRALQDTKGKTASNARLVGNAAYLNAMELLERVKTIPNADVSRAQHALRMVSERLRGSGDFGSGSPATINCENEIATCLQIIEANIAGLYNPETLEGATVNIESTCQKILGKLKIRIELKKK